MRVLLVEPPQADPAQPYSSLAVLLSAWRHAGLEVAVKDLNLDFYNYLCSPKNIRHTGEKIARKLSLALHRDDVELQTLQRAAAFVGGLESGIPKALKVLKTPDLFYKPQMYAWAVRFLHRALETISAPYYPGRISLQSFKTAQSYHSTHGITAATEDFETNMFIQYCEQVIIPALLIEKPDVLAVSVTFQTQIIPAYTLASKAKRLLPELKIVFGGATITRIREGLSQSPELFANVDAYVLFEGETAFPALMQEWERGRVGLNAPNVLLLTQKGPAASHSLHTEDMNSLKPPDHSGLSIDSYWWPEPALLINSSRGCYYGRCAFCMISPATWGPERMGKSYRVRSMEKVIDDLIFANKQTGAKAFNLANDILPPRTLFEIGEQIKNRQLPFTWDSEIRLDRGLSQLVLQTMAEGGCKHLRFGFETASARVGKLMDKGTDLGVTNRIINDCYDVGITVSLLCQIGFPGESVDEAVETLTFLENSNNRVAFVSLTQFSLERGSIVFQNPQRFGVTIHQLPQSEDLAWTYGYARSDGIDVNQTTQLFEKIEMALDQSYPDRDLFFKGGLGHAHTTLYARRYSPQIFCTWNKRVQRDSAALENQAVLRTSKGLGFSPYSNNSKQGWSRFNVSSVEVPELSATVDGSALLVLLAGKEPTSAEKLIQWVRYLSGDTYSVDDAKDIIDSLFEAGLFLSVSKDNRAVPLL